MHGKRDYQYVCRTNSGASVEVTATNKWAARLYAAECLGVGVGNIVYCERIVICA